NGMAVRLNQEDGLADLEIEPGTKSIWADVKRIHLGSSPRRMRTVIKKANSQIKRSGGTAGIAFIHIERPRLRASFDDRVPTDIAPFVDEALRELGSSNSKSVGRVVVSWDDYFVHAAPGSPSIYTVRRRSIVL